MSQEAIVGVIGGMGPEATIDFMIKVLRSTPAKTDSDHIRMVVDNNGKIPSRIEAILSNGISPVNEMIDMAKRLESYGVDFLVIPCNTAHYYYEEVKRSVNIPILNILQLTRKRVINQVPGIKRVGILASSAFLATGLYQQTFNIIGIELITPEESIQKSLMNVILAVKEGEVTDHHLIVVKNAIEGLSNNGAESVVIGCTELSVLTDRIIDAPVPLFDSSLILAEETVKLAKNWRGVV